MKHKFIIQIENFVGVCETCNQELSALDECECPPGEAFGHYFRSKASFGRKLICECGSDKTGLPTHSSWCPKNRG